MIPQWVIEKKRDGIALSKEEIDFFIEGYTDDSIPDYQAAALAMAIYLKGMTFEETASLTYAMMNSGDLIDTSMLTRPKIDKHSTGGIGDKVSLILAPLVASCGLDVPMISGRGLGITGGTLDKMEAIPGYRCDLSEAEFIKVVQSCGCSIIGQTGEVAPADKKLYAIRDVTATVPSIPLITASIMCKKLAEGIDGLVLDVKWGRGAFMKELEQARELAHNMVRVGTEMGKGMTAVISSMNEPLGCAAGNAVEVAESIECLKGNGPDDLMEVTLALCAEMLLLGGISKTPDEAMELLNQHLASGAALAVFKKMVALQGGSPASIDDPTLLPQAKEIVPLLATRSGFVSSVDAEAIGRGVLLLGAGRTATADPVDHAVGVSQMLKSGAPVKEGESLLQIHVNDPATLNAALEHFNQAFEIQDEAVAKKSLITEIIK